MSNLNSLKTRVTAIKSVSKVTKSMSMISNIKIRSAKSSFEDGLKYCEKIILQLALINAKFPKNALMKKFITNTNKTQVIDVVAENQVEDIAPVDEANLLSDDEAKNELPTIILVLLTSDRGLCGTFNLDLNNKALNYIKNNYTSYKIKVFCIGNKGYDFLSRSKLADKIELVHISQANCNQELISTLASHFFNLLTDDEIYQVRIIYTSYLSMISSELKNKVILPFSFLDSRFEEYLANEISEEKIKMTLIEVEEEKIFNFLIFKLLRSYLNLYISENILCEHISRSTSMENATQNANQLIDDTTLLINKTRQEMVTNEIIDIIGGIV